MQVLATSLAAHAESQPQKQHEHVTLVCLHTFQTNQKPPCAAASMSCVHARQLAFAGCLQVEPLKPTHLVISHGITTCGPVQVAELTAQLQAGEDACRDYSEQLSSLQSKVTETEAARVTTAAELASTLQLSDARADEITSLQRALNAARELQQAGAAEIARLGDKLACVTESLGARDAELATEGAESARLAAKLADSVAARARLEQELIVAVDRGAAKQWDVERMTGRIEELREAAAAQKRDAESATQVHAAESAAHAEAIAALTQQLEEVSDARHDAAEQVLL